MEKGIILIRNIDGHLERGKSECSKTRKARLADSITKKGQKAKDYQSFNNDENLINTDEAGMLWSNVRSYLLYDKKIQLEYPIKNRYNFEQNLSFDVKCNIVNWPQVNKTGKEHVEFNTYHMVNCSSDNSMVLMGSVVESSEYFNNPSQNILFSKKKSKAKQNQESYAIVLTKPVRELREEKTAIGPNSCRNYDKDCETLLVPGHRHCRSNSDLVGSGKYSDGTYLDSELTFRNAGNDNTEKKFKFEDYIEQGNRALIDKSKSENNTKRSRVSQNGSNYDVLGNHMLDVSYLDKEGVVCISQQMNQKTFNTEQILEIVQSDTHTGRKKNIVITQSKDQDKNNLITIDTNKLAIGYDRNESYLDSEENGTDQEDQQIVINTHSNQNTFRVKKKVNEIQENGNSDNGDIEITIGVGGVGGFGSTDSEENNLDMESTDKNFVESCQMTYGTTKNEDFTKNRNIEPNGDYTDRDEYRTTGDMQYQSRFVSHYDNPGRTNYNMSQFDKDQIMVMNYANCNERSYEKNEFGSAMNQVQQGFYKPTLFSNQNDNFSQENPQEYNTDIADEDLERNYHKKNIIKQKLPENINSQFCPYYQEKEGASERTELEKNTITEEDFANSQTTSEKDIVFNVSPSRYQVDLSNNAKGKLVINKKMNFKKKPNNEITIAYKNAKKGYDKKHQSHKQSPLNTEINENFRGKIATSQTQFQQESDQESKSSELDPNQIQKEFTESNHRLDKVLKRNQELSKNLINNQQKVIIKPLEESKKQSSAKYDAQKQIQDKYGFFKNSEQINQKTSKNPSESKNIFLSDRNFNNTKDISFNNISHKGFFQKATEDSNDKFLDKNFGGTLTSREFEYTQSNFGNTNGRQTDASRNSKIGWRNFFNKHKKLDADHHFDLTESFKSRGSSAKPQNYMNTGTNFSDNGEKFFYKNDFTVSKEHKESGVTTQEGCRTSQKPQSQSLNNNLDQIENDNCHLLAKLKNYTLEFSQIKNKKPDNRTASEKVLNLRDRSAEIFRKKKSVAHRINTQTSKNTDDEPENAKVQNFRYLTMQKKLQNGIGYEGLLSSESRTEQKLFEIPQKDNISSIQLSLEAKVSKLKSRESNCKSDGMQKLQSGRSEKNAYIPSTTIQDDIRSYQNRRVATESKNQSAKGCCVDTGEKKNGLFNEMLNEDFVKKRFDLNRPNQQKKSQKLFSCSKNTDDNIVEPFGVSSENPYAGDNGGFFTSRTENSNKKRSKAVSASDVIANFYNNKRFTSIKASNNTKEDQRKSYNIPIKVSKPIDSFVEGKNDQKNFYIESNDEKIKSNRLLGISSIKEDTLIRKSNSELAMGSSAILKGKTILVHDLLRDRSPVYLPINQDYSRQDCFDKRNKSKLHESDRLNRISISPIRKRQKREQDKHNSVAINRLEKSGEILEMKSNQHELHDFNSDIGQIAKQVGYSEQERETMNRYIV